MMSAIESMMRGPAGSPPDPCALTDYGYITVTKGFAASVYYNNARALGRTQVSSFVDPSKKTAVIGTIGQSNITAVAPNAYSITNTGKIDDLSLDDGGIYTHIDPPIGCTGPQGVTGGGVGHMFGRLADKMITAGWFDRVIGCHAAIGGTTVQEWATGGGLNNRLTALANRMQGNGRIPTAVLWQQGEGNIGTSQANYTLWLGQVIATLRSAGLTCPIFIAKTTYSAGTTDANVQAAQAAAVNHPNGIWAGADTDQFGSGSRNTDNVHFIDAGFDSVSTEWKTKLALFGAPFA